MRELEHEVKRAQRGDREAFIRLFRRLEPELYGLAKSILKRDEDCADARLNSKIPMQLQANSNWIRTARSSKIT